LTQRQARVESAIGSTEQLIGQLRARQGGGSANQCLTSEAAWRNCLQGIQRHAALITDPAYARRAQDQFTFLVGRFSSLAHGDAGPDVRALQDWLAALQDEKQKILQQMNQQSQTRRSTP
jgi:hypothetical protein